MSEEKALQQARTVFHTLCEMLDGQDWRYNKDEENLAIECGAQGDGLPIKIKMQIDQKRQLIMLTSPLTFTVPEKRRAALAVAVSRANNGMVDGSFDYDYLNGHLVFRLTSSYRESVIGKALLEYMLIVSCRTIDEYNSKFLALTKNTMTHQEILAFVE